MNKFRFVFAPSLEQQGESYLGDVVGSYESARSIGDAIADYTLLLHKRGLMVDDSNFGVVEQMVDGEWQVFED